MSIIYSFGQVTTDVASGSRLAILSDSEVQIYHRQAYPNYPPIYVLQATTTPGEQYISAAFSSTTSVRLEASEADVVYEIGVNAVVTEGISDVTGTDDPLNVNGLSAAQGGAVTVTGGTSSTAANAGGAISLVGGTPGATGVGGAASITSGAGGSTSGASGTVTVASGTTTAGSGSATGAVTLQSGAGAASAAAVAGGASGAIVVQSQAGGANTGGATGQVGGAAGSVSVTGGAGGATNSTGAHAGGAGGDLTFTAGAGGAASAGTGDGGAGGTISLVNGAGGTSAGGTAGVPGVTKLGGVAGANAFALNVARNAITDTATLTDAQHRAQVIFQDASGGAVTCTTRTGTQLAAAFPDLAVGNAIALYHASNHASNTSTISGGTDVTLVGSGAVINTGGQYLLIKTAATTFDLVRVG